MNYPVTKFIFYPVGGYILYCGYHYYLVNQPKAKIDKHSSLAKIIRIESKFHECNYYPQLINTYK